MCPGWTAYTLQMNTTQMQYYTKRNECESEIICCPNKKSSTFCHCHTLHFHSFLTYSQNFWLRMIVYYTSLYVYEKSVYTEMLEEEFRTQIKHKCFLTESYCVS